jgi:hypothetical protein
MRKRLFLILVLALALVLLFTCSSCRKKNTSLDKFEQLILSTSASEENGEAFASAIYVVIPSKASVELSSRAKALADTLSEKTGIETFLKYDSEPTVDGTFELLLGYTSRLISIENLGDLRDDDYICRYDRGCIVLGGKSESATIAALERFESDILPGASHAAIMSENANFEVYGEYELEELTINGYPIYEYTILYSEESCEIAELLQRYVREKTGYTLSANPNESNDAQAGRCISLALDDSLGSAARIDCKNGDIVLSAPDLCGLSLSAAIFTSELCEALSNGTSQVTIEDSRALDYSKSGIDIAFGFANTSGEPDISFLLSLAEAIRKTDSSIICFYPTDKSLAGDINLNCPTTRTALTLDVGNGKCLPVLYNTADFSSLTAEQHDGTVWITAVATDGKSWKVRIDDNSGEDIIYHSDEILLLSGTRLGDGKIDVLASATYGGIENLVYSESALCTESETVAEYSNQNRYYGILSTELVEKYHESYVALKDALK